MTIGPNKVSQQFSQLKERVDSLLWEQDLREAGLAKRFAIRALQIAYAVIRDLIEGQLSLRAMSLVYYTVIATIPLLALAFAVLKGLGLHNAMEPALLNLLEPLGDRSIEITNSIISFVENVRVDVLSFVSLGVLLYTVLNMMQKIELSFNFIWCVTQGRRFASRISEYLFAIIVSPLLIFLSIGISSYINTNFFERYLESLAFGGTLLQVIGFSSAFLFMSLAFAFAYTFIPNTRVQLGSAFIGGIMTTFIWKTMGGLFQEFFVNSSTNEIIYVAFFTVILVMIFIYLGWLVLLTGSSIAYYHQYPEKAQIGRRKTALSIVEQEELSLSILYLISERFNTKKEPWTSSELASKLRNNPIVTDHIINMLCEMDLIRATDEDPTRYLPTHALSDASVIELRDSIRRFTPEPIIRAHHSRTRDLIKQFLKSADDTLLQEIGEIKFSDLQANNQKSAQDSSEKKSNDHE
ncbi:MAG: YihY/virulence factor BrkB family protein [Pseudohongiellaceae bacterium]|nr:YihY/virulence factor BrkB family protein [Pseudohongiellaceae bacterium]